MHRRLGALLLVLALGGPAFAQNWEASVGFGLASPQGEFRSSLGQNGYGIVGDIGYAPAVNPYFIGLSVGYLVYGSESRKEPFSTTIPDVTVDVNTTNALVIAQLLLKFQPNRGVLRPYMQGALGVNYLFTTTQITSENTIAFEEVASSTNESDAAFAYGGGAGLLIRLSGPAGEGEESPSEFLIDLGARYMVGGEADYLKEGSIRRVNGRVVYDTQRSATDLLLFQVGVAFRF